MTKLLKGGPFDGTTVSGQKEDNLWITLYTLNGTPWNAPHNVFAKDFPHGVIRHGYRKQKDGHFQHAWSRPSGE